MLANRGLMANRNLSWQHVPHFQSNVDAVYAAALARLKKRSLGDWRPPRWMAIVPPHRVWNFNWRRYRRPLLPTTIYSA